MLEPSRSVYRLVRVGVDGSLVAGFRSRTVTDRDDLALGELMERAYAGTVDEQLGGNSDGAVEVAGWRAAGALAEASVAVVEADESLVSACMCSGSLDGEVWIAYVITDPLWKGHGFATAAMAESVRRLRAHGVVDVLAGVTDGNVPSERLLEAIGFERVGPA